MVQNTVSVGVRRPPSSSEGNVRPNPARRANNSCEIRSRARCARSAAPNGAVLLRDRLAADLHAAFPEMAGLSARNLKYMRAFSEAYPDLQFVQQVVALLPWGHNVRLLEAVKWRTERNWCPPHDRERVESKRHGASDRKRSLCPAGSRAH